MTDRRIMLACLLLLCLGYAPAYGETQQSAPPSWEKYKVIVEKNIFLRERSNYDYRRRSEFTRTSFAQEERPKSAAVLRGIIRQGSEYIAFLENTSTGVTLRVAAGGDYADGRVARIELDRIEYEKDDQTVTVTLGSNLQGEPAAGASSYGQQTSMQQGESTEAEGSSGPASTTSGEPGDAASIIERLRQRRLAEMRGSPSAQPVAAPAPAPTPAPAAATTTDEASILEQLRQRRLKEMNGQ